MKLNALPGREAQGAVAVLVRDGIDGEILSRGHASAGNLAADHEHEVLADALLLAVLAGVAVFLLIAAVELEELLVVLTEMIIVPSQLSADAAA